MPSRLLLGVFFSLRPPHQKYTHFRSVLKRKQYFREIAADRERLRKVRKTWEERGWESSGELEDVTAIRLLQKSAYSVSDEFDESEDDEVPVSDKRR